MPDGRRVLITGISSELAGVAASTLARRDDIASIVGVDVVEPTDDLGRTEFVELDLQDPALARLIDTSEIDTVLHMGAVSDPGIEDDRRAMSERRVLDATQLLAACRTADGVKRFVLESSTVFYGSEHTDPAMFPETATPPAPPEGLGRDVAEIERRVRDFARERPAVGVSVLRFANVVGPHVGDALRSLFVASPVVPRVLGFDPRLQFCHESDAAEVLVRVVTQAHPGITNVAGPGALYLSQCIRLAGRLPLPVPAPLASLVASFAARTGGFEVAPDSLRFLRYGRVVDTTRLRTQIGVTPDFSSREAFEEFVHGSRDGGHTPSGGMR